MTGDLRRVATLLALSAALASCSTPARDAVLPSIVLITLDTTRADRLGAMGYTAARTPALDALAAEGALFRQAFASSSLTLPSHATILTGLEPYEHGVRDNSRFVVPNSLLTVAELLKAHGYSTGAFVGAFVLDSAFGLAQGFDEYDDTIRQDRRPLSFHVPSRPADEVTDAALHWIANRDETFFAWVHYYDAHVPHTPPPPFDTMEDSYDGAVAFMDQEIGRLLERLRKTQRPVAVIVVSDHGESLGEHGEATHGILAYDSTLHVPLIVRGPGVAPGRRVETFVRTLDIAPTILSFAGADKPDRMTGVALTDLSAGRAKAPEIGWFESYGPFHTLGWAAITGVRNSRWKLTMTPEPRELFDTLEDPGELANRIGRRLGAESDLGAAYEELQNTTPAPAASPRAPDSETMDRLSALGYISVARPPDPSENAPDPRKLVRSTALVDRARQFGAEGQIGRAVTALEILATNPAVRALALRSLAPVLLLAGRTDEAVTAYRRLADHNPSLGTELDWIGALIAGQRHQEALDGLRAVESGGALPVRYHRYKIDALLALRRYDEAAATADSLIERFPRNPAAHAGQALATWALAGPRAASAELRDYVDAAGNSWTAAGEALFLLGRVLHDAGRSSDALELLRGAPEENWEAIALRGKIRADRGNVEAATEIYQRVVHARPAVRAWREELIDLLERGGRWQDSISHYDLLLDGSPADPVLHANRGGALLRTGDRTEAEAAYRRALGLEETLAPVHLNLGMLLLEDDRNPAEARALLERAVELDPSLRKAHFHLAALYREAGDSRSAAHAEQAAGGTGTATLPR